MAKKKQKGRLKSVRAWGGRVATNACDVDRVKGASAKSALMSAGILALSAGGPLLATQAWAPGVTLTLLGLACLGLRELAKD